MIIALDQDGQELFESLTKATKDFLRLEGNGIIEVNFVSEEEIKDLNAQTRNINKVTDVLSFPMLEEIMPFTKENYPFDFDEQADAVMIGSIVICNSIAKKQAEEYGHSLMREESYLFLHGLLHLLGYDHMEEGDKKNMRKMEEDILSTVSITR